MDVICYNSLMGLAIPLTVINFAGTALIMLTLNWYNKLREDEDIMDDAEIIENVRKLSPDKLISVTTDVLHKSSLPESDKTQLVKIIELIPGYFDYIKDSERNHLIATLDKLRD